MPSRMPTTVGEPQGALTSRRVPSPDPKTSKQREQTPTILRASDKCAERCPRPQLQAACHNGVYVGLQAQNGAEPPILGPSFLQPWTHGCRGPRASKGQRAGAPQPTVPSARTGGVDVWVAAGAGRITDTGVWGTTRIK